MTDEPGTEVDSAFELPSRLRKSVSCPITLWRVISWRDEIAIVPETLIWKIHATSVPVLMLHTIQYTLPKINLIYPDSFLLLQGERQALSGTKKVYINS